MIARRTGFATDGAMLGRSVFRAQHAKSMSADALATVLLQSYAETLLVDAAPQVVFVAWPPSRHEYRKMNSLTSQGASPMKEP